MWNDYTVSSAGRKRNHDLNLEHRQGSITNIRIHLVVCKWLQTIATGDEPSCPRSSGLELISSRHQRTRIVSSSLGVCVVIQLTSSFGKLYAKPIYRKEEFVRSFSCTVASECACFAWCGIKPRSSRHLRTRKTLIMLRSYLVAWELGNFGKFSHAKERFGLILINQIYHRSCITLSCTLWELCCLESPMRIR
jgi:hypothetical protein